MQFESTVNTSLGNLKVKTRTLPWIGVFLTLGLFRKVECRITGSALSRYRRAVKRALRECGYANVPPKKWGGVQTCYAAFFEVKSLHDSMVINALLKGASLTAFHQLIRSIRILKREESAKNTAVAQRSSTLIDYN